EATAIADRPPAPPAPAARRSPRANPREPLARSPPCPRGSSCPPRQSRTRLRFPKTRRFLHSTSWSSLDDAWSWLARLRFFDTISLRDDHPIPNQALRRGRARYPIYGLKSFNLRRWVRFVTSPSLVMPGHSRSKNGVASAYALRAAAD